MASKAQIEAARRNIKKAQAARKGKGFGLSGFSLKGFNTQDMLSHLKNAGLALVGFMVGREASRKLIKFDPANPSQVKKYLGSILQMGGGLVLATQSKKEEFKYLGIGLMAGGGLDLVQKLTNKDFYNDGLLNGLKGLGASIAGLKGVDQRRSYLPALERLARQEMGDDIIIDNGTEYELVEEGEFVED